MGASGADARSTERIVYGGGMITRTSAQLEVSQATFAEIQAAMSAAGYDHAMGTYAGRALVEMDGVAIIEREIDIDEPPFFFAFAHLPPHLQAVSRPFAAMARTIMALPDNREREKALDKLLESKDAAVRAALMK